MKGDSYVNAAKSSERTARDEELVYGLADLFKIFGDTTRMRILYALIGGERCVNSLADGLGISQSAISHQLRVLKDSDLVRTRRDGKQICYSLADRHVRTIIAQGWNHLAEKMKPGRRS